MVISEDLKANPFNDVINLRSMIKG